jgi:hypothetical protein
VLTRRLHKLLDLLATSLTSLAADGVMPAAPGSGAAPAGQAPAVNTAAAAAAMLLPTPAAAAAAGGGRGYVYEDIREGSVGLDDGAMPWVDSWDDVAEIGAAAAAAAAAEGWGPGISEGSRKGSKRSLADLSAADEEEGGEGRWGVLDEDRPLPAKRKRVPKGFADDLGGGGVSGDFAGDAAVGDGGGGRGARKAGRLPKAAEVRRRRGMLGGWG